MNRFYGWDLSTKRSAIVLLGNDGPKVIASWTKGPSSQDLPKVLDFFSRQIERLSWSPDQTPFFFIDWSVNEVFAYPKTSKRYLNIKSFLAGWIYRELTSRGAVVAFLSPLGVRKGLNLKGRGSKETVHRELYLRYYIPRGVYNEHELDAIALALVGKKIVSSNRPAVKKILL